MIFIDKLGLDEWKYWHLADCTQGCYGLFQITLGGRFLSCFYMVSVKSVLKAKNRLLRKISKFKRRYLNLPKLKASQVFAAFVLVLQLFYVGSPLLQLNVAQAVTHDATLFEDYFEQNGSSLTNKWDNVSNGSSGSRKTLDGSFTVGVTGNGILLKGDSGHNPNPDDSAERIIATKGYASLTIEYSRALNSIESDDSFKAQYSLDNATYVDLETLSSNQSHSLFSLTIPNPDRHTRLALRFFINGNNNDDKVGIDDVKVYGDGAPFFYDGFETISSFPGGGWTKEESPTIHDENGFNEIWTDNNNGNKGQSANIDGSSNDNPDDVIVTELLALNLQSVQVRYARETDIGSSDNFKSYYSVNNGAWQLLENLTGDHNFASVDFPLAGADSANSLRLRFEMNGNSSGDDAFIDDVVVWGDPAPTTAKIRAFKYFDANQNGLFNEEDGDYPMSGWRISLYNDRGFTFIADRTTGADGYTDYWEDVLVEDPNELVLQEQPEQDGWIAINPTARGGGGYGTYWDGEVVIVGGGTYTFSFGNWHAPFNSISGMKWNDLNGNGARDNGEPGLSGWTMNLSGSASASVLTDVDGNYSFTNLLDGTYKVCEAQQSDWTETAPVNDVCDGDAQGGYNVPGLSGGMNVEDKDFGNVKKAHIIVRKVTDPESAEDSFTFSLTGNNGFNLSNGGEQMFDVIEGTYTVSETVPSGWDLTDISCEYDGDSVGESAPPNGETVTVDPGDTVTCTFTNTKRASFSLEKISDPDSGSFQFDLTGPTQDGVPASTTFNPSGVWDLSNLLQGAYSLSEIILSPENWTGSQVIACNGDGDNDPNVSIANPLEFTLHPGENMSCTVNNTQDALITGKKFEDMNANGIAGEDPGRSGWTITATRQDDPNTEDVVEGGSYPTTTDSEGDYILRVPPGAYEICETIQRGWFQSYPTESTANSTSCGDGYSGYKLTVIAGDNINGKDFGNYQQGSISGFKWEDLDGNGVWHQPNGFANEPGLSDWTINLFNGMATTTVDTNEDGFYEFTNLTPGTYTMSEVSQEGWTQTFPGANTDSKHTLTVTSGESEEDWNFGNFRNVTITGFKWNDTNGDGIWQKLCEENDLGCVAETGLQDVTVALGRVKGEPRQGDGHEIIPIEIIALSLTSANGSFTISDVGPGHYKLFEESRSGWRATNPASRLDSFFDITYRIDLQPQQKPLVQDSFFDVFVELSGQNVSQSEVSVPLEFGNHQTGVDLMMTKTINNNALSQNASASFNLTVKNNGINSATNVVVDDVLTPGLTFVSSVASQGSYDNTTGQWQVGTLAGGAEATLSITARTGAIASGEFVNTATASSDQIDDILNNNTARVSFTIGNQGGGGSGGSGGGGGPQVLGTTSEGGTSGGTQELLIISGELGLSVRNDAVFITWNTNHPATSRVIYDTVSHPVLGAAPNYGYAFSTVEDSAMTTSHSVTVLGLVSTMPYFFRAVSHGSPEVMSGEIAVTTGSLSFGADGSSGSGSAGSLTGSESGLGQVLGANTELPRTGVDMSYLLLVSLMTASGVWLKRKGK